MARHAMANSAERNPFYNRGVSYETYSIWSALRRWRQHNHQEARHRAPEPEPQICRCRMSTRWPGNAKLCGTCGLELYAPLYAERRCGECGRWRGQHYDTSAHRTALFDVRMRCPVGLGHFTPRAA